MSESGETRILLSRYTDAYIVAKVAVGIGNLIKTVGIVLGILIFFAAFSLGSFAGVSSRGSESGGEFMVILFIGAINAFIVGFIFYVVGIIVSAQGQILRASLDSAVNSSPFLTNERKSQIMSLRAQSGNSPSNLEQRIAVGQENQIATEQPIIDPIEKLKEQRRQSAQCMECGEYLGPIDYMTGQKICRNCR
jgi:hypothetical protein